MKRFLRLLVGAAALAGALIVYERYLQPPSAEELERLRQERRALSEQIRQRLADELRSVPSDASVVLGISPRFAEGLVQEVAPVLLHDMKLRFRDISVHKTGDLQAKILIGRQQLGSFALTLHLDEVEILLRSGKPRVQFDAERIAVRLPVTVAAGTGRGHIRFEWDGRGLAGGVCGDLDLHGDIAGTIVPGEHVLAGSLALAAVGSSLVAQPELDDLELKLHIEPSAETWELVDKAMQDRSAMCRTALKTADVPEKIRAFVARGFPVTLPRRLLRQVRFPVEMEREIDVDGKPLHFQVRPAGLTLTPTRLWHGADIRLVDAPVAEPSQ